MTTVRVFGDDPDTLTFKRDERAAHESWGAQVEVLSQPFNPYRYLVYKWKDGWAVSRPKHPLLDDLDGVYRTRDYAMQACADDFAVIARLRRWQEYMKTHEPPEEPC
jgi:hypothetical protein